MIKPVSLFLLIACCLLWIPGCKKENTESSSNVSAEQVKDKAMEAVEAGGAYLNQQKEMIFNKASETYSQLEKETQQLISQLNASGKEVWQNVSDDLGKKLNLSKEKLDTLKQAGKEDLQKTQDAFNDAAEQLRKAYEKAKAEFQKESS